MERACGVLLPIFSLPSPYGIGTLGKAAYDFADFLHHAGQSFWQILPLGPTGYGDSPYQSFSAYAGNPYLIDLDLLVQDGLLTADDCAALTVDDPRKIDYGKLYETRFALLSKAKERGWERDRTAIDTFVKAQKWLPDYALFMALKRRFSMKPWTEWDDPAARRRDPIALDRYRAELREDVELFTYIQFLFFRQWTALKTYVNQLGIRIIGDLPIYVALDSSDVWAEPQYFLLDGGGRPTEIAGVPPDYFNRDGQLWGNPLYNYAAMQRDGWAWWIRRIDGAKLLYDVIRIDHFCGFARFWSVPCGAKSAREGRWNDGPGIALIGTLTAWFPELCFIAEDLGVASPQLTKLLRSSRLPGMKVLSFAFSPDEISGHLPHTYPENCVCYTGTHDNAPLVAWYASASPEERRFAETYLAAGGAVPEAILRAGLRSRAMLFIAPMQDWLGLGEGHRINLPGNGAGNWTWRMLSGEAEASLAAKMHEAARIYGRLPKEPLPN